MYDIFPRINQFTNQLLLLNYKINQTINEISKPLKGTSLMKYKKIILFNKFTTILKINMIVSILN